ncbi:hypothetical protein CUC15_09960 [Oceanobacillus zhaokaii]|uniref:Uncharacterized protein n=1 Tax=Oceanobacillus zhaokaii TaxID=2052660 RepID=A0A345PGV4_9BACI|nr:hypothetical protein [Oceanobacillus zhaokaii]AXI09234.1 hypothetical protein CUC15_09960 [Oceanobacillus zhaokaii]
MNKAEKTAAINVLNFLCNGAKIEGLNFYGLKLLLSENENNLNRIEGQIYINIESQFCLLKSLPKSIPSLEDLPELDWIESSKLLCELRLKQIIEVSLHHESPHLFMTFETGEVLFIWGHHEKYESWQVGVSESTEMWEVVACPNNSLAVWGLEDIIGKNI